MAVIAPHPDDETLACAGALIEAGQRQLPAVVILLTAGEAHEVAWALVACVRRRRMVGPELRAGAVRALVGTPAMPRLRVVVSLWGQSDGCRVALEQAGELQWQGLNRRRWASLPGRISDMRPAVLIDTGSHVYRLVADYLCGPADRSYLGLLRLREARGALWKLGCNNLVYAGLPDGKSQQWWDWHGARPIGPGLVAVLLIERTLMQLPPPVMILSPHSCDADLDHRAAAALVSVAAAGVKGRRLGYLVHYSGNDHWRVGQPAPAMPHPEMIINVDVARKRSALLRHVSQVRADYTGTMLQVTGQEWLWEVGDGHGAV